MAPQKQKQYTENDALDWVEQTAKRRRWRLQLHRQLARRDGDYLYLPAHLPLKDAYLKAQRLQEIEDSWNNRTPLPIPRLVLVPTKD